MAAGMEKAVTYDERERAVTAGTVTLQQTFQHTPLVACRQCRHSHMPQPSTLSLPRAASLQRPKAVATAACFSHNTAFLLFAASTPSSFSSTRQQGFSAACHATSHAHACHACHACHRTSCRAIRRLFLPSHAIFMPSASSLPAMPHKIHAATAHTQPMLLTHTCHTRQDLCALPACRERGRGGGWGWGGVCGQCRGWMAGEEDTDR